MKNYFNYSSYRTNTVEFSRTYYDVTLTSNISLFAIGDTFNYVKIFAHDGIVEFVKDPNNKVSLKLSFDLK